MINETNININCILNCYRLVNDYDFTVIGYTSHKGLLFFLAFRTQRSNLHSFVSIICDFIKETTYYLWTAPCYSLFAQVLLSVNLVLSFIFASFLWNISKITTQTIFTSLADSFIQYENIRFYLFINNYLAILQLFRLSLLKETIRGYWKIK